MVGEGLCPFASPVLDTLLGAIEAIVDQDTNETDHNRHEDPRKYYVGQPDLVLHITLTQQQELEEPAHSVREVVVVLNWLHSFKHRAGVAPQLGGSVALVEQLDPLCVELWDFLLELLGSSLPGELHFNALLTHNGHEVVRGVAQLWALEPDSAEVIN